MSMKWHHRVDDNNWISHDFDPDDPDGKRIVAVGIQMLFAVVIWPILGFEFFSAMHVAVIVGVACLGWQTTDTPQKSNFWIIIFILAVVFGFFGFVLWVGVTSKR